MTGRQKQPPLGHDYFMDLALDEARQALAAGDFPVGCVIVRDGREVVACSRRINSTGPGRNELDHAEIIALRLLHQADDENDRQRLTLYSTMEPCLMCFATLLLSGIPTIVYGFEDPMGGGTNLPRTVLSPLYRDLQMTVIGQVRRQECLAPFASFFTDTRNTYWRDSLLAQYVLNASQSFASPEELHS